MNDFANGGYDEFENGDEKEQKNGMQEDQFMLRPNFSDDPEDQWDIVAFFDKNEKFKQFKPILMLQMQIQNAVHNNDDGMDHNDQLDHLLDSMLNPNDRNDSSSESDDEDFDAEPDSMSFRDYINTGYMPSSASLVYDVILNDYSFDTGPSLRGHDDDEKSPFYASIDYARPIGLSADSEADGKTEHFLSMALRSNIKREEMTRDKLNCVVVLETSSTMRSPFMGSNGADSGGQSRSKQAVANQIVCDVLDCLDEDDRFCLLSFSDLAKMEQPLYDLKSMDLAAIKSQIAAIPTAPGGVDFDEGYNAALAQLQELFDAQIMAAAHLNAEDDGKEDECTENRFVFVTANLPEADSSLMDLMQVYSESEENKIYTTFLNVGDLAPSTKLTSSICKMRGCNIRNYDAATFAADFESVLHPIFFNVNLTVHGLATDTIYGYNNSMKRITKLSQHGSVRTVKTVYLHGAMDEEVVTMRLQPEADDDADIGFEVEMKYEGRDGKEEVIPRRSVQLRKLKEAVCDDEGAGGYFDNKRIRKRIALIKWAELLGEWAARDRKDDDSQHLNVSGEYKRRFEAFMKVFEAQYRQIGDEAMLREIEIMHSLINFDETEAAKLREEQ